MDELDFSDSSTKYEMAAQLEYIDRKNPSSGNLNTSK